MATNMPVSREVYRLMLDSSSSLDYPKLSIPIIEDVLSSLEAEFGTGQFVVSGFPFVTLQNRMARNHPEAASYVLVPLYLRNVLRLLDEIGRLTEEEGASFDPGQLQGLFSSLESAFKMLEEGDIEEFSPETHTAALPYFNGLLKSFASVFYHRPSLAPFLDRNPRFFSVPFASLCQIMITLNNLDKDERKELPVFFAPEVESFLSATFSDFVSKHSGLPFTPRLHWTYLVLFSFLFSYSSSPASQKLTDLFIYRVSLKKDKPAFLAEYTLARWPLVSLAFQSFDFFLDLDEEFISIDSEGNMKHSSFSESTKTVFFHIMELVTASFSALSIHHGFGRTMPDFFPAVDKFLSASSLLENRHPFFNEVEFNNLQLNPIITSALFYYVMSSPLSPAEIIHLYPNVFRRIVYASCLVCTEQYLIDLNRGSYAIHQSLALFHYFVSHPSCQSGDFLRKALIKSGQFVHLLKYLRFSHSSEQRASINVVTSPFSLENPFYAVTIFWVPFASLLSSLSSLPNDKELVTNALSYKYFLNGACFQFSTLSDEDFPPWYEAGTPSSLLFRFFFFSPHIDILKRFPLDPTCHTIGSIFFRASAYTFDKVSSLLSKSHFAFSPDSPSFSRVFSLILDYAKTVRSMALRFLAKSADPLATDETRRKFARSVRKVAPRGIRRFQFKENTEVREEAIAVDCLAASRELIEAIREVVKLGTRVPEKAKKMK